MKEENRLVIFKSGRRIVLPANVVFNFSGDEITQEVDLSPLTDGEIEEIKINPSKYDKFRNKLTPKEKKSNIK